MKVETGKIAVTKGGDLQSKYIIHAVGPVWKGEDNEEETNNLLFSCVFRSLTRASKFGNITQFK